MTDTCPCLSTIDRIETLTFQPQPDGSLVLPFQTKAGLCQLSVIVDASAIDWEELYIVINRHGNVDARTGPWDFDWQNENKPLVPSYWVEVNGKRLGLWFFQRISLEDLEAKRFRGRVAFHVPEAGETTLRLVPYRPMPITWISARLEIDPEDHLELLPDSIGAVPTIEWEALRKDLTTTHAIYAEPLSRATAWAMTKPTAPRLRLLLAAWKLEANTAARDLAFATIDDAIALPYWGNPATDGYSHNGDMGAAYMLRSLAWALHDVGDSLGDQRRTALIAKLKLQGQCFFEQMLLNRDYWGGSVLQDHGWSSTYAFANAALTLRGILPEADLWCAYSLPRARRCLAAMPQDGVIPSSSYNSLFMYLSELAHFRDTWRAVSGQDIYASHPFHAIIDYLVAVVREETQTMIFCSQTGGDAHTFIGGNAFLNQIASTYRDGRSARLAQLLLERQQDTFYHPGEEGAYYEGFLWGLLTHDPAVTPTPLPTPPRLTFCDDSGFAHFRDPTTEVTLSVQSGPWCGYNAYRKAQGPCDRMEIAPGAGHFSIALGNQPLLVTPDFGYRLITGLRSALLIDGQGQHGDVGYPMSIPSKRHHGDEIQTAHWDDSTSTGLIRLNLAPAYPERLGVISYTRDFLLGTDRSLTVRDHLLLREPRQLSWLFQGKREFGIAHDDLHATFGKGDLRLHLTPAVGSPPLTASLHQTDIVWSYCSISGFKPFDHIRYDTHETQTHTAVDFCFTW